MHPAKSVIIFTALSGLGYGLLSILYIAWLIHGAAPDYYLYYGFIALTCVSIGLLSSLFHLGHPERAWRALSQWRSSWLSREGVLSMLSFIPPLMLVFVDNIIIVSIGLIINIASVFATSMIYASLRPIPAWHHALVPLNYLIISTVSGLFAYNILVFITPHYTLVSDDMLYIGVIIMLIGKLAYWLYIHHHQSTSNIGTATGLGKLGSVRLIDPPHDGSNYLMQEMIYKTARNNVIMIKILSLLCWALTATLLIIFGNNSFMPALYMILICIGVLMERWLFFAEAKHVVSLYY